MNIHSLRDLENQDKDQKNSTQYRALREARPEEPINTSESTCSKLKTTLQHCFPNITWKSLSFVLILLLLLVFCVDLVLYRVAHAKAASAVPSSVNEKVLWSCVLYRSGSNFPPAVVQHAELWRLFSAVFLHADFSHIFGNVLSLLFISFYIEAFLVSKLKFLGLFCLAGIYGNILSGMLDVTKQGIGASGGIFGLYAFLLLVFVFHHKQMAESRKQIFLYFLLSFVVNFFSSFNNFQQTNVGVFAHLGGFISGLVLGFFFLDLKENHLLLSEKWLSRLIFSQKVFLAAFLLTIIGSVHYYFGMEMGSDYLKGNCSGVF